LAKGIPLLGLVSEDLETMNKTDWRKAILACLVRGHCSVKLDWIAKELHMRVRIGVTRAEQLLKAKLEKHKPAQKLWGDLTEIRYFYACSLFFWFLKMAD